MDKIENERIWISGLNTVKDLRHQIFGQVSYAVNLSSWCDTELVHDERYAHLSIEDGGDLKYKDFALTCDFVWNLMQREKGDILVHCAAGISRSVTVAAAALARKNQLSVREQIQLIKDSRGIQQDPSPKNVGYAEEWLEETT